MGYRQSGGVTEVNGSLASTSRGKLERHKISLLDNTSFKFKAYRVLPLKKNIIEDQVDQVLQDNIIETSCLPWSSPVFLVLKPKPDAYPMLLIHDILESLEDCLLVQHIGFAISLLAGGNGGEEP